MNAEINLHKQAIEYELQDQYPDQNSEVQDWDRDFQNSILRPRFESGKLQTCIWLHSNIESKWELGCTK